MNLFNKRLVLRNLFAVLLFAGCVQAQTLKQIAVIDLPGPKGERFDYLTMDDEDHYLLSAHLGPGILYVIDVRTNKLVEAIPGVPGITGVEYVPSLRKVYTSDWGEEKIGVVELRSMASPSGFPRLPSPTAAPTPHRFTRCTFPIRSEKPSRLSTWKKTKS